MSRNYFPRLIETSVSKVVIEALSKVEKGFASLMPCEPDMTLNFYSDVFRFKQNN